MIKLTINLSCTWIKFREKRESVDGYLYPRRLWGRGGGEHW